MKLFPWALAALLGAASGCAAATRAPPRAPPVEAFPGAHFLAKALVDGRVEALLHFERLPLHSAKRYLADLYGWTKPLEDIGLDPTGDVRRAYVTARSATTSAKLIVLQHRADPARVRARLGAAGRVPRAPHRVVDIDGNGYLLCAPGDDLLVLAPKALRGKLDAFARVGGLPGPSPSGEAAVYAADRPSESVNAGPTWPLGFDRARTLLVVDAAGGAHVRFEGTTRATFSPEVNAEQLQEMMDRALSFRVPVLGEVRLFEPPRAVVAGERVVAGAYFTSDEFEWLVGVGTWMLDVDLGRSHGGAPRQDARRE